jgi:hypothetical protein
MLATPVSDSLAAPGAGRAAPAEMGPIYDWAIDERISQLSGTRSQAARPLLPALALALLVGVTAWVTGAQAAAVPSPIPAHPAGGVNVQGLGSGVNPAAADAEIARAKALHTTVVRASLPWSVMEPAGPGRLSPRALAFSDRLLGDAASAGIRVILTVDSSPCWATSAPASLARLCVGAGANPANAWPPKDPQAYAAFVAFLAARYGTRLAAIEIWNEPDQSNQLYFAGPHKAERYAAILRAAYPAIKAANPQVPVLAGSLVGSNGTFLRSLYAAGIKGYYDGLAVHFYTLVLGSLRSFRNVQVANGDSKPLWLDEFGWSNCYPRHRLQEEQACVTTAVQAANVADVFRELARTPYVAAEVLYDLQDSGREKFGVLSASGARKPAFKALSGVLTAPFGRVHPVTLTLRASRGRTVASGSGPVGDFMGLEAFQGSTLRYRALFTLDRFNRYSIKLPAVLGSHGLRVRVFQYWAGVGTGPVRSN